MTRRGSHPVGSSLALPILVLLAASAVEFGTFFRKYETIAAVAYAGAKAGALADRDAVARASAAAEDRWADSELSGSLELAVSTGGPDGDRHVEVQATVEAAPVFGLVALSPIPITCTRTVKIGRVHRVALSPHP